MYCKELCASIICDCYGGNDQMGQHFLQLIFKYLWYFYDIHYLC